MIVVNLFVDILIKCCVYENIHWDSPQSPTLTQRMLVITLTTHFDSINSRSFVTLCFKCFAKYFFIYLSETFFNENRLKSSSSSSVGIFLVFDRLYHCIEFECGIKPKTSIVVDSFAHHTVLIMIILSSCECSISNSFIYSFSYGFCSLILNFFGS